MNLSSPPGPAARPTEHGVQLEDGRRLHAVSWGEGPDLVVLEAGMGAAALSWGPVMEHLAPHVRVLAYDRAGYGASDPDLRPRDLARLASDLVALCAAIPHERLVLAGHSWGGPVARMALARLLAAGPEPGEQLAGLVLVDPSDEHAQMYFSRAMQVQSAVQGPLLAALARLGLLRPLLRAQMAALPEPYRSAAVDAVATPAAVAAIRAESAHVVRGLRFLQRHPLMLDAVPLTVLSGRRAGALDRAVRDGLSAAHAATARAHRAGRLVEAQRSGHLIPVTEPELVADEILSLLR